MNLIHLNSMHTYIGRLPVNSYIGRLPVMTTMYARTLMPCIRLTVLGYVVDVPSKQRNQMVRLFFNIWPFAMIKNSPIM